MPIIGTIQPIPSSSRVSAFMSAQRTKDTKPELALRRALHARGVRFRLNRRDLPGRPDLAIVRPRLAVFMDGCFWHACPDHFTAPKANRDWWSHKLELNSARDRRNDALLANMGWEPFHVWEHEDPQVVADGLAARWFQHSTVPLKW